jgi:hypothetical protein
MSQDANDLRRYIVELHDLLDAQSPKPEGGGGHKIVGSPAPWNEPIGALLMDIHAASRQCADALSRELDEPVRSRGSTDAGTMIALDLCVLNSRRLHKRDPGNAIPEAVAHRLRTLAIRCREALDLVRPGEERWSRAPGGLLCPNRLPDGKECGEPLWLAPGWQLEDKPPIFCLSARDSCVLEDGSPYSWPWDAWFRVVTGLAFDRPPAQPARQTAPCSQG